MKTLTTISLALVLFAGAVCGQQPPLSDTPAPRPKTDPPLLGTIGYQPKGIDDPRRAEDAARLAAALKKVAWAKQQADEREAQQGLVRLGIYAPYDKLLRAHVEQGRVDYARLAEDEMNLQSFLETLGKVVPASLKTPAEQKAFWINAYNAFTLQLILDHLPGIESIKDIASGERWKAVRWEVDGKRYSLDQIEHEILRPLGDARIHFALVCAAQSCPDLLSEAYLPATLDEQLDRAGRAFLASTAKGLSFGTVDGTLWGRNHVVRLSAIFDWFEEDFGSNEREVIDFVLKFAPPPAADFIRAHRDDLDVRHLDYDWSLNGRSVSGGQAGGR